MKLSELLKQYRSENKISQRELARRCGLSNSLISLMEMGVNPQTGKEMSPEEIDTVLAERRKNWKPKPVRYESGVLRLFARLAASPMKGAYLDC